ncbi:MAG: hypothetical protein R3245_10730 [Kiloniellales bacterium]|nr:hypothetical protein [Kiloniellales bacterium]
MRNLLERKFSILIPVVLVLVLAACDNSRDQVLATTQSQVALRQMQTRAFDTIDRDQMLRSVISTLQDLSFVVDRADHVLGMVSATKLDGYQMRITVSVRQRGEAQLLVRANAQYQNTAVEEPEPYQQFFSALSKSAFLTAHNVD